MKAKLFSTATAVVASTLTTLLGGWDKALEILLIFIILDYVTGMGAAYKTKTLRSSVGFEGLFKKGSIFLVVVLAAQLDRLTGTGTPIFRTATCFFFIANDGLSILENVSEMGVALPSFLTKALAKIRDQNDNLESQTEDVRAVGKENESSENRSD